MTREGNQRTSNVLAPRQQHLLIASVNRVDVIQNKNNKQLEIRIAHRYYTRKICYRVF